jgi:hypothetical protein
MYDATGNVRYVEMGDLEALGHPHTVQVTP